MRIVLSKMEAAGAETATGDDQLRKNECKASVAPNLSDPDVRIYIVLFK